MGRIKSKRSSLKMGQVIRKKAKAKKERERKLYKHKQMPKKGRKNLIAPMSLPNREQIAEEVHQSSEFLQNVMKPLASQVSASIDNSYDSQLKSMKQEIKDKYHERVDQAIQSYNTAFNALQEYDAFIEVLDARDPSACRFLAAEGSILGEKKPLIILINKIDMVPREAVVGWLNELRRTAPSVALMGIDQETSEKCLRSIIESVCPKANKIAVMGLPNVGKSTICAYNTRLLTELPAFSFAIASEELSLMQTAVWTDPMYHLALATINRAVSSQEQPDFYSIYGLPDNESPEAILSLLAQKWNVKPKAAAKLLMEHFWNGSQKWFCVPPPVKSNKSENDAQLAALEFSRPMDLCLDPFVQFTAGQAFQINEELLGETFEEEDEEEEEGTEEEK